MSKDSAAPDGLPREGQSEYFGHRNDPDMGQVSPSIKTKAAPTYPPEGMSLAQPDSYYGRFLLEPEEAPDRKGEIFVEQAPPPVGTVVQAPAGRGGAIGRRVLHKPYAGTKTVINEKEYLIIDGEHLLLWLGDEDEVDPNG